MLSRQGDIGNTVNPVPHHRTQRKITEKGVVGRGASRPGVGAPPLPFPPVSAFQGPPTSLCLEVIIPTWKLAVKIVNERGIQLHEGRRPIRLVLPWSHGPQHSAGHRVGAQPGVAVWQPLTPALLHYGASGYCRGRMRRDAR